jgi:hypothetical protein
LGAIIGYLLGKRFLWRIVLKVTGAILKEVGIALLLLERARYSKDKSQL